MDELRIKICTNDQTRTWYCKILDQNKRCLMTSRHWKTLEKCMDGIDSLRFYGVQKDKYSLVNERYDYWFELKTTSGLVIATGESFTTFLRRDIAVNQLLLHIAKAVIEE